MQIGLFRINENQINHKAEGKNKTKGKPLGNEHLDNHGGGLQSTTHL
jgi:hypothetical protein